MIGVRPVRWPLSRLEGCRPASFTNWLPCRKRWGAADKAAIQLVQVQPCQLPKSDT